MKEEEVRVQKENVTANNKITTLCNVKYTRKMQKMFLNKTETIML